MSDSSALSRALAELEALRREVELLTTRHDSALAFLDRIRDALPHVVYLFDVPRRRTIYLNRHVGRELGYDAAQIAAFGDQILEHLLHPDDLARLPELLGRWDHVRDGEVLSTEHRLRHTSGEWRTFLGRDVVFKRDAAGRVEQLLGTSMDVTVQKRLEGRLAHGQRLEALGRFAGGIAHDFNNVLTAVLGAAELARDQMERGVQPHEEVDEITAAGRQAAALTRQLLAFARQQIVASEVFEVNDAVQEALRMISRLVGEDVEIDLALAPDAGALRADRAQITQVVLNLALNGRDAMPRGGRLAISTRPVQLASGSPERQAETVPGDYVRIAVADEGTGMDADVRERAFEPLFTTKPGGAGTGLGLAIVQGIVHQCGGQIRLASEPGRGTRVEVDLPRVSGSAGVARPEAPRLATAGLRDRTVLVAEDDAAVGGLVRDVLAAAGARVLLARDGEEALALAARHGRPIDLVVSDVVLPRLSGPEVVRRLRAAQPGLRALLVSGYAPASYAATPPADGDEFLQKPFTPRALIERAAALLGAGG